MIYCDGERDQFDEREFHHHGGRLFKPYIHLKKDQIPAHFADGGLPVELKEDEQGPDHISVLVTNRPPYVVSVVEPRLYEATLRELESSFTTEGDTPETVDMGTALHYGGLAWPLPVAVIKDDPLADQKKALYQAQLQVVTGKLQGFIDHDKAVRASDAPLHQAVFQAYIDAAKGQLDRSVTRGQFIATAAGAIGTAYAAVIGLSFGLGQAGHALPARGMAPAVFLALAIAFAAVYLSYITKSSPDQNTSVSADVPPWIVAFRTPNRVIAPTAQRQASFLPAQRLIEERDDFITWVTHTVVDRLHWLHAAVISLVMGVFFLPVPFLAIADWVAWVGVAIGLVVVGVPLAKYNLPLVVKAIRAALAKRRGQVQIEELKSHGDSSLRSE